MVFGLVKEHIVDVGVEEAFKQLEGTFNDEQRLAYAEVEKGCNFASVFMYGTLVWVPVSLVGVSVAIFGYDYSILWVLLFPTSYPYLAYKVIKLRAYAMLDKAKFYSTLGANLAQLHGETKEVLTKFIKAF